MSIVVDKLSFSYGSREVLKNVSFTAEYGQFLSVLGPNGVGKSTLFRCMLGILKPKSGGTIIDGAEVSGLTAAELAKRIAYIPQSHSPVFNFSVFDMVLMGTTAQTGHFSSPGAKQAARVEAALEKLGISHLRDRGYGELSGGERQLTLIARAIAQQAKIFVMDEPSASLDFGNRIRVMQTMRDLAREGYCVIQSTHDPDQAYLWSDKILALHGGGVLAWGTPREIMTSDLVSRLYGVGVEVCRVGDGDLRVCIPARVEKENE